MKRGVTMVETVVALAAAASLLGVLFACHHMLERQTRIAGEGLDQAQAATRLMERIRLELSGMVMNPLPHPADHRGNSLLVSEHGNAIQFVTERREGAKVARVLVSYEARAGEKALKLTKRVWEFTREQEWTERLSNGWPAGWTGRLLETREAEFAALSIQDVVFQYLVPEDDGNQVYVRVKLVLRSAGGRLLPLTTLVGVPSPRAVAAASTCPCVNAPCYDPAKPDCACCLGETEEAAAQESTAPEEPQPNLDEEPTPAIPEDANESSKEDQE